MKEVRTQGLVLLTSDYKDNDKQVRLLTCDLGKIYAIFKGVRKPNAKLKNAASIMFFGTFELVSNGGFYTVKGCEAHESFFDICLDYDKFDIACKMITMVDSLVPFGTPCNAQLVLLLKFLQLLLCSEADRQVIYIKFLLEFSHVCGVKTVWNNKCSICGNDTTKKFFDASYGVLCSKCTKTAQVLSDFAFGVIRQIDATPQDRLHTLKYDSRIANVAEFLAQAQKIE